MKVQEPTEQHDPVETVSLLEQHLENTGDAMDDNGRRLSRVLSERLGSGAASPRQKVDDQTNFIAFASVDS